MSAAAELMEKLRRLDIRLSLDGERLNCNAPKGALTAELRTELGQHKEAIKQLMRQAASTAALGEEIEKLPRGGPLPVSHSQQRLWFLRQMDPDSVAYNIPGALELMGPLDADALERAIATIVGRHEIVRCHFVSVDGEPQCLVDDALQFWLRRFDVSTGSPDDRYLRALTRVHAVARETFDLSKAPLVRAELVKLAADRHILCIVVDHIIADGWSIGVFVRELGALYEAEARGAKLTLPPPAVQFVDYAAWHRRWLENGVLAAQLPYWQKALGTSLPVLQLPSERPRPKLQSHRGSRVMQLLSLPFVDQLKGLAREEGVTFFMLLMAAFDVLLARYSSTEDIVVGTATANRVRPDVEGMIGYCANNLVLRMDLSGNPTVRELLQRVREVALNAYSHQDVPFDVLVEALHPRRDLDRPPLFQAMLNLQPYPGFTLPGLTGKQVELDMGIARLDLAVDVFEGPKAYNACFEYNTDLFDEALIKRMLGHYVLLLQAFLEHREAHIADLPMLFDEERHTLLDEWNPAATPFASDRCVHELFEEQAAKTPDAEAVRFERTSLTYRELNARANQLARHLRKLGVGYESRVGVWLDRSADMIVALLGVLKSGAAYVPLDPAFPADRIAFMFSDAGMAAVVTQERLAATLTVAQPKAVRLDTDAAIIASESAENPEPVAKPASLAYIIYTSGSTGVPKGVALEHRGVVNFLQSMHREPGIGPSDRFVALTTLSFDIAGLEIYGPLTAGGTVVVASRATALDGEGLMALIHSERATIVQATPATWRLLLEAGWSGTQGLKVLCGGEALPRDLADALLATGAEVWNLYGPTETTIWSTAARVLPGADHPTIGKPIANTRTYVLDAQRRPAPIGVPGELYIGGVGVAREYLNRPELTAERFVADPFDTTLGGRMYRTGDMARWRADGTLQCLGRVDHQVKIRGYRVEPGEIETALSKQPQVAQVVVVARADASGEHRLVAYVVGKDAQPVEPATLRKALAASLPEYMIPSVFVQLDALPLTPNGKVDRNALPAPETQASTGAAEFVSPANPTEAAIAEIWQEVLKVERVGRSDNFFDLGGHSLLVVQVQSRLRRRLDRKVMLVELFQHPTVASLATFLAQGADNDDALDAVRERAARQRAARGH